jgi:hypothetical protein
MKLPILLALCATLPCQARAATNTPISGMTETNSVPEDAYFPVIIKPPGMTNYVNFRVSFATLASLLSGSYNPSAGYLPKLNDAGTGWSNSLWFQSDGSDTMELRTQGGATNVWLENEADGYLSIFGKTRVKLQTETNDLEFQDGTLTFDGTDQYGRAGTVVSDQGYSSWLPGTSEATYIVAINGPANGIGTLAVSDMVNGGRIALRAGNGTTPGVIENYTAWVLHWRSATCSMVFSTNEISFAAGGVYSAKFSTNGLILLDTYNSSWVPVTFGTNDSGGTGYRMLVVPNRP